MTVFLRDPDVTLHHGDALETLQGLPYESVHCCVTSPPYFGLRDYGTGRWEGGDPGCDHLRPLLGGSGAQTQGVTDQALKLRQQYADVCGKCGARRVDRQLGLEQTPEEYVARMVEVFREVRRVLRGDGTLWLVLGDSYASDAGKGGSGTANGRNNRGEGYGRASRPRGGLTGGTTTVSLGAGGGPGLKPKDLVGIPWRVAFALQADGWWIRSDIVWAKPNPMPESVTDRPTKAHEYVFLLAKQPRYFFDADAVREAHSREWWSEEWRVRSREQGLAKGWNSDRGDGGAGAISHSASGRNVRSVWEIATEPYPEAHFAVFPQELARRCILAGCPEGGIVLDPFAGSGTTGYVARKHGRRAVLIELSLSYCKLAATRLAQQSLFAEASA